MNITLSLIKTISEKVHSKGGTTYYVGGCVRDKLLGKPSKDIDIEVHNIDLSEFEKILSGFGEVSKIGAHFGVYNLKGYDIDFSFPRTERKIGKKHTDFEVTIDPYIGLEQSARRRDFTINALMENVLTGEIIDFWGGKNDLTSKIIRHIDDKTFIEDPLRVLRAAQFSARFGFKVAPETLELCGHISLAELSRERIFIEVEKALLRSDKPSIFFDQLRYMNQLDYWFPELKTLIGAKQNEQYHQEGDVWNHTMLVLDEAAKLRDRTKQPLYFMLSALCHDFGKPIALSVDENGVSHTFTHETAGLSIIKAFLERLTSGKMLLRYVLNMTELHMQPNIKAENKSRIKSTNKMFDQSVEPRDLITLAECDSRGKIPKGKINTEFLCERLGIYREMMKAPYLTGDDLIAVGFVPCVEFSDVLAYAHKLRLAGVSKGHALSQTIWYAKKKGCKRNDIE